MTSNWPLSTSGVATFATGAASFDGNGHFISFPNQAGSFFVINDNVDVAMTDVVLKDYNPDAVNVSAVGASLNVIEQYPPGRSTGWPGSPDLLPHLEKVDDH